MPLGRDSEEKDDYMSRHPPWGVSDLSQRLGASVLEFYMEETNPFYRFEDCCNR